MEEPGNARLVACRGRTKGERRSPCPSACRLHNAAARSRGGHPVSAAALPGAAGART